MVQKLVDNQGIESSLASLSDEDITTICDVIRRSGGLLSMKMLDRGNQISILAANNLKLTAFMFKSIEHYARPNI